MTGEPPPDEIPPDAGLETDPHSPHDRDMLSIPVLAAIAMRPATILHQAASGKAAMPCAVRPTANGPAIADVRQVAPPLAQPSTQTPPRAFSLRAFCGPVHDQGKLNACTAHAAAALMSIVHNRLHGSIFEGSRMFAYKVTRDMLQWVGDSGAYLRTAAGALTLFGMPPEKYWGYETDRLDVAPSAFCFQLGAHFRSDSHFRIDSEGVDAQGVVTRIKGLLEHGIPAMIGYTVYFAAEYAGRTTADIPLPIATDLKVGGHAVTICGFDDDRTIVNTATGGATSTGAFLIQNSRGEGWGDRGFGWLPYDYFAHGLVNDVWSVIHADWIDLTAYEEGRVHAAAGPVAPDTAAQ